MKFSIKDLFSKCDEIRRKLRIWLHLLKKSLMENFIFLCSVWYQHNWTPHNIVNAKDLTVVPFPFSRASLTVSSPTQVQPYKNTRSMLLTSRFFSFFMTKIQFYDDTAQKVHFSILHSTFLTSSCCIHVIHKTYRISSKK